VRRARLIVLALVAATVLASGCGGAQNGGSGTARPHPSTPQRDISSPRVAVIGHWHVADPDLDYYFSRTKVTMVNLAGASSSRYKVVSQDLGTRTLTFNLSGDTYPIRFVFNSDYTGFQYLQATVVYVDEKQAP